jgi:hypothetical protein
MSRTSIVALKQHAALPFELPPHLPIDFVLNEGCSAHQATRKPIQAKAKTLMLPTNHGLTRF